MPKRQPSKRAARSNLLHKIKRSTQQQREHAAAAGGILAFTLIFFAPLFSGRTYSMVGAHMYVQYPWAGTLSEDPSVGGRGYPQTDHAETYFPNSVFATRAIRSGQLPVWLPYSFGGIPLLELGLTGFLYPPRLLAMLVLAPIRQHDFLLFGHLLLAGLAMYALLRCWGAGAIGAVLGAMVWELNGHNAFWLVMEHVSIAAAWLPVMLLAATLAVHRQSFAWAIGAGVAVGTAFLSGSLHYVYLGSLVLGAWYLFLIVHAVRARLLEGKRLAALLCISLPVCSAIVAAAISAAVWLPLTQWVGSVNREPPTLRIQLAEAISPRDLGRGLIHPRFAWGSAGRAADQASFGYVGILALIAAVAALLRLSAPVILSASIAVLSVGFAAGVPPLTVILRWALPLFSTVHPHSGLYLFTFAIGVLAALGMTEGLSRISGISRISRIRLPRLLWLWFGSAAVAIEAIQLIVFATSINPVQPEAARWFFPETPLLATLRRLQGEYRVLPVSRREQQWTPPMLAGKVAAVFELRSGSGYESLVPDRTAELWRTIEQGGVAGAEIPPAFRPIYFHDRLPLKLLEKTSVGLLAVPPGVAPLDVSGGDPQTDGTLELVYQGRDGWIYKLKRSLPRAYVAPRVVTASDAATAFQTFIDPKFNASQAAVVEQDHEAVETALRSVESDGGLDASANIISDLANEVEIEAETSRAAVLVLNDSWAPGWKAFVDGTEQPVLPVNYAFRGVAVKEGRHRVVFRYRPPLLMIGLAVTGVSLVLALGFFVRPGLAALRFGQATTSVR